MISSTLKIHPNSLYRWIQEYEKEEKSLCQEKPLIKPSNSLL
ncbi:TPA: hypothetical protein ACPXEZ_002107 [Streptococcus pneumoniae]|nr:hypothetical protein [Streptococcus pneumoniae]